jgi:hypothetical protein
MCSVLTGGRLPTSNSTKSRNSHMEEMSEADSNPESPKMSPRKNEEEKIEERDVDEELSVGSPGIIKKLRKKIQKDSFCICGSEKTCKIIKFN